MKSNEKLSFDDVVDPVEVNYPGPYVLTVFVGERGKKWRTYAYLFECNQDASREGIRDETCGRGDSPENAVNQWAKNAIDGGWEAAPVKKAAAELFDLLDEI